MRDGVLRVRIAANALLRQNRVLITLLLLWPFVLSGILLVTSRGKPEPDDITAILQQELVYGLALVALAASSAFGMEKKARRVQQLLGRALGRGEYLLALATASFLPFVGYVLVWLLNASLFGEAPGMHLPALWALCVCELAAGFLLCCAGILLSVMLTQLVAMAATGVVLGLAFMAATHGWQTIGFVFGGVSGLSSFPDVVALWTSAGEAVLGGTVLLGAAIALFHRRDLALD